MATDKGIDNYEMFPISDDDRLTRESLNFYSGCWEGMPLRVVREALTLMAERNEARREKLVLRSACSAKDREMDTLRRENEQLQAKGVQAWQRCYAKLERENDAYKMQLTRRDRWAKAWKSKAQAYRDALLDMMGKRSTAIKERDEARRDRWAKAWKRAAKEYYQVWEGTLPLIDYIKRERDEAQAELKSYTDCTWGEVVERLRAADTLRRENEALRELHEKADDLRTQVIEYDKVDEEQELLVAVVTNAEFHALCDALDKLDAMKGGDHE